MRSRALGEGDASGLHVLNGIDIAVQSRGGFAKVEDDKGVAGQVGIEVVFEYEDGSTETRFIDLF